MKRVPFPATVDCQQGVSLLAAVFFLLLFSVLAALMANMVMTSNTTSALDVQGVRAYQAARAGAEWGLYAVLQDPANASPASAAAPLAGCFTPSPKAIGAIPDFAVSVTCELFPLAGNAQEGTRNIRHYRIVSTATGTGPGIGIERQITVVAEKCRDTASTAAPYDC